MASILSYLEVRDGALTCASQFALGEARRIANAVGATVYGLLALPGASDAEVEGLARTVSALGADRILCCVSQALAQAHVPPSHFSLAFYVTQKLSAAWVILPAGEIGHALGSLLASRLGGRYAQLQRLDIQSSVDEVTGEVQHQLLLHLDGESSAKPLEARSLGTPLVLSLPEGKPQGRVGESFSDVEMIPFPSRAEEKALG